MELTEAQKSAILAERKQFDEDVESMARIEATKMRFKEEGRDFDKELKEWEISNATT